MHSARTPWYRYSVLFLSSLCLVGLQPAGAAEPPAHNLTSARAIAIARAFCAKNDVPCEGTANAEFPVAADPDRPSYWQQRWHVTISDHETVELEIEIGDSTGTVVRFDNKKLERERDREHRLRKPEIPRDEALKLTLRAMAAAGDDDDLDIYYLRVYYLPGTGDEYEPRHWLSNWMRMYRGVHFYYDQSASVSLDAETGKLEFLIKRFTLPVPNLPSLLISPDDVFNTIGPHALAEAAQKLKTKFVTDGLTWIVLGIVQPRAQINWGETPDYLPVSRLAWRILYKLKGGWSGIGLWIDAETGEIIGGDDWSSMPPPIEPYQPPLEDNSDFIEAEEAKTSRNPLNNAVSFRVCRASDKEQKPLVVLSEKSHPGMYYSLREGGRFPIRHATVDGKPDVYIVSINGVILDDEPYPLGYYSELGVLVLHDRVVLVDDYFKNYISRVLGSKK